MRKLYYLILAITSLSLSASAQYTSYDFEPIAGTQGCSYITIDDYNKIMNNTGCFFGDTFKTGYIPQLYLLEESCDDGKPFSGKFFIGIASSSSKSDKLSLKLAEATVNYRIYSMVMHIKKPKSGNSIDLELGYSFDCDNVGATFQTISKPTDTAWDTVSIPLAPPVGTKYITITGKPGGSTTPLRNFTHVDDIQISWVATDVAEVNTNRPVNVYPNPFNNSASFTIDESMVLPCQVSIYDMTGRKVYSNNLNTRKATIEKGNLNTGMYIMELNDSKGNSGRTRIMIN